MITKWLYHSKRTPQYNIDVMTEKDVKHYIHLKIRYDYNAKWSKGNNLSDFYNFRAIYSQTKPQTEKLVGCLS